MNKRLIFICLVVLGMTAQAQTDGFSINLGLTLPTNVGTSADSDDPVGMGTGFSAGLRFQYGIGTGNLHHFANVGIRYNGLSSDGKSLLNKSKRMLDETWGYDGNDASSSIKGSSYWYIPLVTGLNYSYPLGESLALWGEVGTGLVLWQGSGD